MNRSRSLWRRFDRLSRAEHGSVAVEFALLLPILLLMALATVDVTRYLITVHKVHRAAATTADLTARTDNSHEVNGAGTIHQGQIDSVFTAVNAITAPLVIGDTGGVILSGVVRADANGGTKIAWQQKNPPAMGQASQLGSVGTAPTLPASFKLSNNDTAIFAEAYYVFQPYSFSSGLLGSDLINLYELSVYRPRLSSLSKVVQP